MSFYNDIYQRRREELKRLPAIFAPFTTLTKISDIYINTSNYLVVNGHQLYTGRGTIQLSHHGANTERKELAGRVGSSNEFRFRDGSTILTDNFGYMVLKSSNSNMPDIYITTVVNTSPGMATAQNFAGNDFFYNNNLGKVHITIQEVKNEHKLASIKMMKNYMASLGLKEAKESVDGEKPKLVPEKIPVEEARELVLRLSEIGCKASIQPTERILQTIISAEDFYQENIAKFIGHIVNYAPAG
ncbi:ribosomal protein L7/L12 [Ferruginibacter sp.]